jgi:hypothetical protein
MTARRCAAIAGTAVATTLAVALAASGQTGTAKERPRGVVEDCSRVSGFGASLRDFTLPRNLVVGPLALLRAGITLQYAPSVGGNKLFVVVKGGHRVTLELSHDTRRNVGLVFGHFRNPNVRLRDSRRVVTFVACRRGERREWMHGDRWPVSGWVGGLLASSPRCVPLLVWVDDEPTPRRAVIRFGVSSCG